MSFFITYNELEPQRVHWLAMEQSRSLPPYAFKVVDGDGNLCFAGFSSEPDHFAPLDYGAAEYGATAIFYWHESNEEWVEL